MITKGSNRLDIVASLVPKGSKVYDIGSDHGYLPIYLFDNAISQYVIACENKSGPFKRLYSNVSKYPSIKPILADGLDGYEEEIDTITASGLGGKTIISIFTKFFQEHSKRELTIILEPQSSFYEVRKFMMDSGYKAIKELYVREKGKYYPIVVYIRGQEELDELELNYGKYALDNLDEVLKSYLDKTYLTYQSIGDKADKDKMKLVKEALARWTRRN